MGRSAGSYLFFLFIFAAASAVFAFAILGDTPEGEKLLNLAFIEAGIALIMLVAGVIARKKSSKKLEKYIETVTYETENARDKTLMNFPLPIAVFMMDDSKIIWGNEMFFEMCGSIGTRLDARISDLVPSFTAKWLVEGKRQYPTLITLGERKYRVHGNIVRPENAKSDGSFMAITYWIDVTEYDDIRIKYEQTRPVAGVVVIDNLEELYKNQPDRIKNDIRDAVEDKLKEWAQSYSGFVRRFDRDKYITVFSKESFDLMREEKFSVIETMHSIESPSGITATISLGFGEDAADFPEAMQFADMASELALTRGGDQAVIKNRLSFEFFGGRGSEVEKRTKVKSRVMANTLNELIKDSSRIFVMGHRYSDLDSIGAAVGICCIARKYGKKYGIVVDEESTAASPLIERMKKEPEYKNAFISVQDAILHSDGRTLLVVVDTNRPEQVEDSDLLDACNRIAVIDHHRVSSTYIANTTLGFIEPFASSCCELLSEVLEEVMENGDVSKPEAEALLAGIVLDTKNFTLRTGERTFDAAAWLRRTGADTTEVKKLLQSDISDTISKYKILQSAELYRSVAVAVPTETQNRVVAAKAADELLNISGVEASVVIAPGEDGCVFASARSIGELNVQILMEKLGGGGNKSAAAVRFQDLELHEAVEKVYRAIDDYFDNK